MRTKNNIKSPKQDSLRGIGKLGWTEGGKMHSTIKRLISSFVSPVNRQKSKKHIIVCPKCKSRLKTNNIGRVPKHYTYLYRGYRKNKDICEGSYCRQLSGKVEVIEKDSYHGNIYVGDKVAIDFTRDILKPYSDIDEVIETKITRIEIIYKLRNDGSRHNSEKILIYFEGINTPIPGYYLFNHIIKID